MVIGRTVARLRPGEVFLYIYMHVCVCVYVYMYTCGTWNRESVSSRDVFIYTCTYACMYVLIQWGDFVQNRCGVCVCMYICIYV
jgi:hypothetical protein